VLEGRSWFLVEMLWQDVCCHHGGVGKMDQDLYIGNGRKSIRREFEMGLPVCFLQTMKPYRVPQGVEKDSSVKAQLVSKLQKARDWRYISARKVESFTAFFAVEKEEDNVQPVYDGSVSGLNDSIWMPQFVLPQLSRRISGRWKLEPKCVIWM
jgi:hypothetical protein